jgi:hypothetical protein
MKSISSILKAKLDDVVMTTLQKEAYNISQAARKNASFDKAIVDAISVSPPYKNENGVYSIDVVVDTNEDTGAPEAVAFEYGSGIHATRGKAGKYLIVPRKQGGKLVFPLSRWPKWVPEGAAQPDKSGLFHLSSVMHPGVAPRPLIGDAVRRGKQSLRSKLISVVSKAIRESVVEVSFEDRNG